MTPRRRNECSPEEFVEVLKEFKFSDFMWSWLGGKPVGA